MGDYGLKISQPGHDVESATNKQLVFSSSFNTMKHYIVATPSITIPANTAPVTPFNVTYTHNLGFVPAVTVYPNDGTYGKLINAIPPDLRTGNSFINIPIENLEFDYELTSTILKLYLRTYDSGSLPKFWGSNPQYVITFKCYIFTQQIG